MNKGKLKKCLETKYKFEEGIYTLKEWIKKYSVKTGYCCNHYVAYKSDKTYIRIPKIVHDNIIIK